MDLYSTIITLSKKIVPSKFAITELTIFVELAIPEINLCFSRDMFQRQNSCLLGKYFFFLASNISCHCSVGAVKTVAVLTI